MWRSGLRTVLAMTAWAAVHTLLASTASKQKAHRVLGRRATEGWYRLGYNGVAVGTALVLTRYVRALPDRELYRVDGAGRIVLNLARVGLALVALRAALEIGIGPFSGLSEALAYCRGQDTFAAPEGQGPAAVSGSDGRLLKTGGPFRYVRHPLNASASALVFLTPRMTVVRLAVSLVTLVYAVYGSRREERRLLMMYGDAYARYLASGVPFFVPRLLLKPKST